eukprot:scaffold195074_cov32-Tisochrysis_lutea.AAC.3
MASNAAALGIDRPPQGTHRAREAQCHQAFVGWRRGDGKVRCNEVPGRRAGGQGPLASSGKAGVRPNKSAH